SPLHWQVEQRGASDMPALTAQIHQPSMKVFTVGLADEKAGVKVDAPEKVHIEKASPVPPSPILVSAPPPMKRSRSFKGLFACFGLLIFALIIAITISEIAYHRQRDEAFFRLKWAELKQRMLGYDLMRTQMQQAAQQQALESSRLQAAAAALPLQQQHGDDAEERPPVVDERLAFSNRLRNSDRAEQTTTEASASSEQEDSPVDVRFAFLRAILDKLRERAAAAGMDGKMHVSLIEVRRPSPAEFHDENNNNVDDVRDLSPDSQAFQDGFGEVAAPHPLTGHFRPDMEQQQERMPASDFFGPRWEHPSQFLPEPVRPWNSFPRGGNADSAFFPRPWEQQSEDEEDRAQPHMRVTHHFDREGAGAPPSRVVTELFGEAGRRALDNMLLRGAPMMQMQQQQMQQEPQPPMGVDSPGSSFPRWEATINDLPRPWLQNQMMMQQQQPIMTHRDFVPPIQQLQQQMQQVPPMLQQPSPQQQPWMQPGPMMNGPYMGPGNFWAIPPVQQPQPPAFPMQQEQNDDAMMGQRLGMNLGMQFRDQEMQRPRLPFGTQELPENDVVEVRPVQGNNEEKQGLQQLPWYVPRGFEHERPAWASDDKTPIVANDVPMIFPHPTAAERPIDAPPTVESTNKPSIANIKATQTDSDFLHEGEVAPPARFAAGNWQHTQPKVADDVPAAAPAIDIARHRLPERDVFDDVPPRPSHDDPSGPANDDIDPSRVLFQVDEPHLAP
ncbi:hypothetical protein PMAYCL1PPCAC_09248, partial [Pristionchus mayeri]